MNSTTEKLLISFILLIVGVLHLPAQEISDFTFSHIGKAEGMHSQRVYSILQTNDGALWWSTKNDVERYNGVSIEHYVLGNPDNYGDRAGKRIKLSSNFEVSTRVPEPSELLAFDNHGNIYSFDVIHNRFTQVSDVSTKIDGLTDLNDVKKIGDSYWLATNKGVFFLHGNSISPVLRNCYANCFVRTNHSLLFCTRQGVMEYSNDLRVAPPSNTHVQMIASCDVESGFYDPIYNNVWFGGYSSGIKVISTNNHQKVADISFPHNPVRAIIPYDKKTMLVGIDGLGIYKVNRNQQSTNNSTATILFNANQGVHGVLYGNGVYALIRDLWGNLVVGTYSGGIDIARPVGSAVDIFQQKGQGNQSILNDRVNSVCQSKSGKLLMGTDNGVSIFDLSSRTWTHTCQGVVVLNFCLTPRGTILAGTYGHGVLELTDKGDVHTLYSTDNGILQDDHVFKVFYDSDGNLWLGGLDGDLVQLTEKGPRYYPVHYVKDILQLPDGRIAIGTTYGLIFINPITGMSEKITYAPKGSKDVNSFIHTLFLNKNSELWIGTDGGGIYIYNIVTRNCYQLTTKDGLPSNFVNTIYKDSKNRIIIATESGLSFADPKNTSHIIGVNYCYGVDREYISRSAVNLSNGNMVLGSTNGALVINPNHIQEIDYTAKLNLVGVTCDEESNDEFREKMYHQLKRRELKLSYRQRTFNLLFESINLRNQSDIVYQYKVDKGEWSKPTNDQSIRFTSMEPGKHKIILRCVSRTCGAVLDEVVLSIKIAHPWWNTWWMWLVYLCLLFLAFYGALRVYQLHNKYMRLVVEDLNRTSTVDNNMVITNNQEESDDESNQFITKATKIVVDNISDSDFNIDRMCREMAMSRTLFYVKLKSYTGKSPQDFIRIIRLERAAQMLRNGSQVTDAASMTGFDNPKYFSTVFKKYFGISPSKYY